MPQLAFISRSKSDATWLIVGLLLAAVPAWAQEVTLSDLDGVTVQYRSVYQQTLVRNGRTFNPKVYQTGSVIIEGNTVRNSFQVTAIHPEGRRDVSPLRSGGTQTIGKPFKGRSGYDVVWTFADGSLNRLLVHTAGGAGGSKLAFEFKREPAGLACSFSNPVMRENGVGDVRRNAATDGKPLQVIQFRLISSSCTVSKTAESTANRGSDQPAK